MILIPAAKAKYRGERTPRQIRKPARQRRRDPVEEADRGDAITMKNPDRQPSGEPGGCRVAAVLLIVLIQSSTFRPVRRAAKFTESGSGFDEGSTSPVTKQ